MGTAYACGRFDSGFVLKRCEDGVSDFLEKLRLSKYNRVDFIWLKCRRKTRGGLLKQIGSCPWVKEHMPTGFWTGWVRPLWFQRGHYVAGHYQPFFPKVSERRHRYVRFFGLGRGSRCYSQPGHGGKFLGNGRWQSENRAAGRHNLSDLFSDRIACFEPKDEIFTLKWPDDKREYYLEWILFT